MESQVPLVSVGIPTFNRAERLRGAVESVLSQDYPEIEVVICDNASTDGTEELGRALAAADARVRYLRNEANIGPTANFNRVRMASRGEYLLWLGDDDRLSPDYVSRCVAALGADPSLALVAGLARYYEGDELRYAGVQVTVRGADPAERVRSFLWQVRDNGTFYGVVPRRVVEAVRPMANRMGNDWGLVVEVAACGGIRTLEEVEIRRSLGGSTRSLKHVARTAGFSWIEGEFPQLAIAVSVADTCLRAPALRPLGSRRALLALQAGLIVLRRFLPEAARKYLALTAGRVASATGRTRGRTPT